MRIRLPQLLNAGMQERKRLHPAELGITFNLYEPHTATAVLPPEEVVLLRDWIRLYTARGDAGVYRVTSVGNSVGFESTIHLKHGLCVLAMDKIKTDEESMSGTLRELLLRFWSMDGVTEAPKYWQIGNVPQTSVLSFKPSNHTLLQACEELLKNSKKYAFSFDQSSFPWTLNVVELSENNRCEGRFGRNLEGVNINVDDSDLYTRAYVDGKDGYTDADTVSTWGVSSEILTVGDNATDESVRAFVNDFLEAHKNPTVTISLSGIDLSKITGESIDGFYPGRICHACLPRYKTTVRELIVSIDFPDVYGDPLRFDVSMTNKAETTSDLLVYNERETNDLSTSTSRRFGGVGAAMEQTDIELIRTKEELTDTRLRMKKAGIVIDGDADFVRLFAYDDDVSLIDQNLKSAMAEIDIQAGLIALKAEQSELDGLSSRVSKAEINLDGANAQILLKASQTSVDALGQRVSQAEIDIDGANSEIELKANKVTVNAVRTEVEGILTSGIVGTGILSATTVSGNYGNFDSLKIGDDPIVTHVATLLTSATLSRGTTSIKDFYGENHTVVTSVSLNTDSETIVYLSL